MTIVCAVWEMYGILWFCFSFFLSLICVCCKNRRRKHGFMVPKVYILTLLSLSLCCDEIWSQFFLLSSNSHRKFQDRLAQAALFKRVGRRRWTFWWWRRGMTSYQNSVSSCHPRWLPVELLEGLHEWWLHTRVLCVCVCVSIWRHVVPFTHAGSLKGAERLIAADVHPGSYESLCDDVDVTQPSSTAGAF